MMVIDQVYICQRKPGEFIFSLTSEHGERHITICNSWTRAEAMRRAGKAASNPEIDFDWYDSERLCRAIRQVVPMPDAWSTMMKLIGEWKGVGSKHGIERNQ